MMITPAQILTILGIICAPMISIATLVLVLAALNLSLGIRKLIVRILAFVFDYATKIKQDKEVTIQSDAPSTPTHTAQSISPFIERSANDPIEIDPTTPLLSESKSHDELTTINDQDRKPSRTPSQTDIQFKLGK